MEGTPLAENVIFKVNVVFNFRDKSFVVNIHHFRISGVDETDLTHFTNSNFHFEIITQTAIIESSH